MKSRREVGGRLMSKNCFDIINVVMSRLLLSDLIEDQDDVEIGASRVPVRPVWRWLLGDPGLIDRVR